MTILANLIHCDGVINLGRADYERDETWCHVVGGRPECPDSPVATPREGTVEVSA